MTDALPQLPLDQNDLIALLGAMLVYHRYRMQKTPPSEERLFTLKVLESLLPLLNQGCGVYEHDRSLLLTVDDVCVLKGGLTTLLALLQCKPASAQLTQEITRLTRLKTLIESTFSTTQD